MNDKIAYRVNRSSAAEIAAHLLYADAHFEPSLSSRVDIRAYAQKLYDRAVRFEASVGEELIGLVAGYCNQPDGGKAFVTSVSVWPEYQGQGIAHRLMRQYIDHVQGLGFGQIELDLDQRRPQALALYQKLGFNTRSSTGSILTMGMTLGDKSI